MFDSDLDSSVGAMSWDWWCFRKRGEVWEPSLNLGGFSCRARENFLLLKRAGFGFRAEVGVGAAVWITRKTSFFFGRGFRETRELS